jgi:sialate O-acetylesterase
MAVAIDIGMTDNIHPINKQEVGRRLGLWARAQVYGEKIPFSGPLPTGHKISGDEIIVSFKHTDGGLVAKGGELTGFVIAGADKKWHWAKARIEGDTVVVSCPEVKSPVAVRYGWADNPKCNLYNGAGLPASPFRTDAW